MARQTLQDELLDIIGVQVVSGVFRAGQVLRTEDFESRHRASRSVLRETLKVLESMGLIGMRPRIGITVLDRSEWNVFDPRIIRWRLEGADRAAQLRSLTDVRLAIEPVAAYSAALRATPEHSDELLRLARALRAAGVPRNAEQYLAHDIAFHTLLLRASGNEMFTALSGSVAAVLTGRIVHRLMPDEPTPESLDLHELVAISIAEGAAERAENAVRNLLTEVKTQIAPQTAAQPASHRR